MQVKYAAANLLLPTEQLLGNSADAQSLQVPIVEQFVSAPLPRAPGLALVDDWDCLRVGICPQLHASSLLRVMTAYNSALCADLAESLLFCLQAYVHCNILLQLMHDDHIWDLSLYGRPFPLSESVKQKLLERPVDKLIPYTGNGRRLGGALRAHGPVWHAEHPHVRQPVQCWNPGGDLCQLGRARLRRRSTCGLRVAAR